MSAKPKNTPNLAPTRSLSDPDDDLELDEILSRSGITPAADPPELVDTEASLSQDLGESMTSDSTSNQAQTSEVAKGDTEPPPEVPPGSQAFVDSVLAQNVKARDLKLVLDQDADDKAAKAALDLYVTCGMLTAGNQLSVFEVLTEFSNLGHLIRNLSDDTSGVFRVLERFLSGLISLNAADEELRDLGVTRHYLTDALTVGMVNAPLREVTPGPAAPSPKPKPPAAPKSVKQRGRPPVPEAQKLAAQKKKEAEAKAKAKAAAAAAAEKKRLKEVAELQKRMAKLTKGK